MGEHGDRVARVVKKQRSGQVDGVKGLQLPGHGARPLDHVVVDGHELHTVKEVLCDSQRQPLPAEGPGHLNTEQDRGHDPFSIPQPAKEVLDRCCAALIKENQ